MSSQLLKEQVSKSGWHCVHNVYPQLLPFLPPPSLAPDSYYYLSRHYGSRVLTDIPISTLVWSAYSQSSSQRNSKHPVMLPSAENFWRLSTSLTVKPKSLQSFALFAFTSLIYQFSIAHTCSSPTGFHAPLLDRVLCICCSSTRILFQMFVWFTHSAPPNLCANITFLVRVF